MEKENNEDWDEFTNALDVSLKSVSNNKINNIIEKKMRYNNYNYQKNIQYKCNGYWLNVYGNYYECNNCNEKYHSIMKFCTNCGSDQIKEYRTQSICHDCKIVFDGKYCPNCGKGENYFEYEHVENNNNDNYNFDDRRSNIKTFGMWFLYTVIMMYSLLYLSTLIWNETPIWFGIIVSLVGWTLTPYLAYKWKHKWK